MHRRPRASASIVRGKGPERPYAAPSVQVSLTPLTDT